MKIHNSSEPAREAGQHISRLIRESKRDIVCLLSGGSALEVVKYIELPVSSECRTIFMMGDERVSGGITENNYLQLQTLYPGYRILEHTIKTTPEPEETQTEFAKRIEITFLQKLTELNNPLIIALLGVGEDGHTAGIFPMDRKSFAETYPDDATYVSVRLQGSEFDSRASFTPGWLLAHVEQIIGFATGKNKANIMYMLTDEQKPLNERPAELLKRHSNAHLYTDQAKQ